MFQSLPQRERKRWSTSMLVSFGVQLALLAALLIHAPAAFVSVSDAQLGIPHSAGSLYITYVAPVGPEQAKAPVEALRLALHTAPPKPKPQKSPPKHEEVAAKTADDAAEQTLRGGSPFGRVPGSPLTDEVVPAFPDVYPDPPVTTADLPPGVHGDVIVEVTIDPRGDVVETKLLQGIGYGIEQKVLDVLQRWHFHPAMRDGVTIASQHIVHFHYPS